MLVLISDIFWLAMYLFHFSTQPQQISIWLVTFSTYHHKEMRLYFLLSIITCNNNNNDDNNNDNPGSRQTITMGSMIKASPKLSTLLPTTGSTHLGATSWTTCTYLPKSSRISWWIWRIQSSSCWSTGLLWLQTSPRAWHPRPCYNCTLAKLCVWRHANVSGTGTICPHTHLGQRLV